MTWFKPFFQAPPFIDFPFSPFLVKSFTPCFIHTELCHLLWVFPGNSVDLNMTVLLVTIICLVYNTESINFHICITETKSTLRVEMVISASLALIAMPGII